MLQDVDLGFSHVDHYPVQCQIAFQAVVDAPRACEKGIVMLPRGVSERVADNLFGCRAFGRHLKGM